MNRSRGLEGLSNIWFCTLARATESVDESSRTQERGKDSSNVGLPVCAGPNALISRPFRVPHGVSHHNVGLKPLGVIEERRHLAASRPDL